MKNNAVKEEFPGRNPPQDRLLTVREVADMLGVSIRLVNRLFATGDLPRVKIGRAARARLFDVQRIIATGVK